MSSDKCTSKKIIYSNNIDTDMVDYNVLVNMLAGVPDREIPNLRCMRDERREIGSNVVEPKKSVKELVQYFEENMSKPLPIPPPRRRRVAQLTQMKSALKKHHQSFNMVFTREPLRQMQNSRHAISEMLGFLLKEKKCIKFSEWLSVHFKKFKDGELEPSGKIMFRSKPELVMNENDILPSLNKSQERILDFIQRWVSQGSGWMIDYVEGHYLNVSKCNPLEGKSYIPLPKELQHHKNGLININNKDDKCFLWCHVRHLNPQETNPQRIKRTDKELVEQLNYKGIEFPVKAKHYNKIEVQNQIKINVFGYENKQFYPIYKSKNAEYEDEMNLLLIAIGETNHCLYSRF